MSANSKPASALAAGLKSKGFWLWVIQVLLACFYAFAGFNKVSMSPEALVEMGMSYVAAVPIALVRFIGVAEIAGALGLILPMATRIRPGLTPLAALGLCAIQLLAMPLHIYRGEYEVLPINLVLLAMAAFVYWGRSRPVADEAAGLRASRPAKRG